MLEKRPLLGLIAAHDRREGGPAIPADHGQVDVGIPAHLPEDELSFRVMAGKAGGHQRQLRVQPGQVRDGVADGAAGGSLNALGDMVSSFCLGQVSMG